MKTSLFPRLAVLIVLTAAGLLVTATPAAAHPTLVATLPEAGYGVSQTPEEIGLIFDEPVTVVSFVVEGQARGKIATTPVRPGADGKVVVRPTSPLPIGRYTVRWQITARDGDAVEGVFGFGIGVTTSPTQDQPVTPGLGVTALLRWALFAGLALALGGLAGHALARRLTPHGPRPFVAVGCLLGLTASLGLGVQQVGGGNLLAGLGRFSLGALVASPAGVLIAFELAAFTAALLTAVSPVRTLTVLPLAVVVIAEGERSHLMAASGGLGGFTIAVHLAAVSLWIGALVHVVRVAWHSRSRPAHARAVLLAYAQLAIGVYAVVVVTGALAALWMLPSPGALLTTGYGWTLLAKLALVILATVLALIARKRLTTKAEPITAVTRIEAITLIAVLAATGLLTAQSPPAEPGFGVPYPPPMAGRTVRLGALTGQVTTAIVAGEGRLEVRLRVPQWDPIRNEGYTIGATLTAPNGTREDLLLTPCGSGCFTGPARWRTGVNTIELTITTDRWRGGTAHFAVPWPASPARTLFDQARDTLAAQPSITFVETVSSDTSRAAGFSKTLRMSGAELLGKQPYRAGVISEPALLERTGDHTVIAFAISAENINVRMTLDTKGHLVREDITTPNHQITRTYQPAEG